MPTGGGSLQKDCVLTASWKCGICQTTALNLPLMLHNDHWDGREDYDVV